ncbi:Alpha-ketoglutarate-dependent 2,4-dichlorophenoxyacetate dioxygenase [Pseudocercospora fuligena]|uniref:Alpha-ketoglutarate-dependent 2,4-dichlorophenoxyacetate dioxygenase n=1 Tax=Pseudocercospora fuligena TaxID=685502 RepID=A0A8H6RLR3_9PEZI|nr:Alpha-ketoglutarate-dependent 2,4-dichlorophenoxyacetate dioxygenase [Pseudocercospora fuligena]
MPETSSSQPFNIKKLHPTFGAEISNLDLSNISDSLFQQLHSAVTKYGFLVLRSTNLTDATHISFSRRFGELDDIRPYITNGRKPRYDFLELFDAGNVDENGQVLASDSPRTHYGKGNGFFHVDSSFNPRRASYSLLRAVAIPPPNTGGNTEFADTRAAFETLPEGMKERLLKDDYVGVHSLHHSRKRGSPEFFQDLNPEEFPMHRHKICQIHELSGRKNLYIGSHLHHIENSNGEKLGEAENFELIWSLMGWATRPENIVSVEWKNVNDLIIWDNTAVMHRAAGGSYEGKFARDLRRTTVHDGSPTAWGLNEKDVDGRPGFSVGGKSLDEAR